MAKNSINLDNLSVQEITQLITEADAKRLQKQEGARTQLIEEMTAKAAQLGLSLEALVGKLTPPKSSTPKVRGDKGQSLAIKYQGPDGQTWTGRGRMPRWLAAAIEKGQSKDQFAV